MTLNLKGLHMKWRSLFRNPAQVAGIILLSAAIAIFFIQPFFAAALALFFVLLCLAACFFPQSNFLLPVISHGNTGKNKVALTFDDGPTEPLTRQILDLLDQYSVKATFFVSGVQTLTCPDIINEIINRGHSIGNHSFHHNPFLMLKSFRVLHQDIESLQELLKENGVNTLAFRPPVGIVNPKLGPILDQLGLVCVTFSCRAWDAGNLHIKHLSSRILAKVEADDIVLLHDVLPRGKEDARFLLTEIDKIIGGIRNRGLIIVPLAELIGKEILIPSGRFNGYLPIK
jgi:peptidoglycan/xylan/chitin deacetylase (PgdA/CDA1 family)